MYLVLEIEFSSTHRYITKLIQAHIKAKKIDAKVIQSATKIYIIAPKEERLQEFLLQLENNLPASLFMGKSRYYFVQSIPNIKDFQIATLPVNIALCPNCQKELFDINSRRYYYPFISCNACGAQAPFLMHYPFERKNSSFKYLQICSKCKEEAKINPFRENYPLISCCECGVSLRMKDKKNERFANDKASYKKLFEVAAKALLDKKTLLVKTLNGYRKFFIPKKGMNLSNVITLFCDANSINSKLMLIPQEFHALLSIERPIIRLSTKSQELKELFGSSLLAKYPDDGITILLAKEVLNLGIEYICYIETEQNCKADFIIDFDLPIESYKDCKLFINQDIKIFVEGERVIFPTLVDNPNKIVSVAHNLSSFKIDKGWIIDKSEKASFDKNYKVHLLKGEKPPFQTENMSYFTQKEAAIASVLKEHKLLNQSAVGVYFDNNIYFLYYNGSKMVELIKPIEFESKNFWKNIASLKESSKRLVENFKKNFPLLYEELDKFEENDIFKAASKILELESVGIEAISKEALNFYGKGGVQIDTKIENKQFNSYAFLSSIMSYKIAGAKKELLCYSIYESFGDYIGEVVQEVINTLETKTIVLSGKSFANQALFARIQKRLGIYTPFFNKNMPLGKENAVFGALYL